MGSHGQNAKSKLEFEILVHGPKKSSQRLAKIMIMHYSLSITTINIEVHSISAIFDKILL